MKRTQFFGCWLLVMMLMACGRTIQCMEPEVNPVFIGYTKEQMQGMVIRRYEESTGFQKLIDTIRLDTNSFYFDIRHDTIDFNITLYPEKRIDAEHNWELFLPSVGKTFQLANFATLQKEEQCGSFNSDCWCINTLSSLSVNNQTVMPVSFAGYSYRFFIRR